MRGALLVLVGLSLFGVVQQARGYSIAGEPWPGPTISVWNTTSYKQPVRDAIRAWNAAGLGVTFTSAPSREGANVVVVVGARGDEGLADVGYGTGHSSVTISRGLGRLVATALAAHELGHVLGLGHESRRCAVMAPVVTLGPGSKCGLGACKTTWKCLVQSDDAAGAAKLYGRRKPS